jgi:molecular chaperone DnaK
MLRRTFESWCTNNEQKISITNSGGLSKADIEKMKNEADKFAAEDKNRRAMVELKNGADTAIYTAEKTLRDAGDKAADHEVKITAAITDLRGSLGTADIEDLKGKVDALNQAVYALSAQMYSQGASSNPQQPSNEGGASGGGASGGSDDNVVDADYEEVK